VNRVEALLVERQAVQEECERARTHCAELLFRIRLALAAREGLDSNDVLNEFVKSAGEWRSAMKHCRTVERELASYAVRSWGAVFYNTGFTPVGQEVQMPHSENPGSDPPSSHWTRSGR
jgi:hypothetical protein